MIERRRRGVRLRTTLGIALGLLMAMAYALAPAAASAASVRLAAPKLIYNAGAGEANAITVTQPDPATLALRDAGVGSITDADGAGGCSVTGADASCPAAGIAQVEIRTDDRDDRA